MRSQEIVSIVKEYFVLGVVGVILLCAIAIVGYFLIYKKHMGGKKTITKKQIIMGILLSGYVIMVFGVTLLNRGSNAMNSTNLHFMSSYREAWNTFSLRSWQFIILNIVMFVPLGILLPICHKRFYNLLWTIGIGALFTILIEVVQLATGFGIFEFDDILNNILGSLFGYSIIMALLSLMKARKYKMRKILIYMIPVFLIITTFSTIFIVYQSKEFGNLTGAYIYKQTMKQANVEVMVKLNDDTPEAYVYHAPTRNKEEAKDYAREYFENIGLETNQMETIAYNDDAIYWIRGKTSYSLWLDFLDGTYRYYDYSSFDDGMVRKNCSEDKLVDVLEQYGIRIPNQAVFESSEQGEYRWEIDAFADGDKLIEGSLTCDYYNDDTIKSIDNHIVVYQQVKKMKLISKNEAYKELLDGKFRIWIDEDIETLTVTGIEMDYQLDSKGYYQPVYMFETVINGTDHAIMIPAL